MAEVFGFRRGRELPREGWRASQVFAPFRSAPVLKAWTGSFQIDQAAAGSYLSVPCHGIHGREAVYAALRVGEQVGRRPPPGPLPTRPTRGSTATAGPTGGATFFIPVTPGMVGREIRVFLLQFPPEDPKKPVEPGRIRPEAWITACPDPHVALRLVLTGPRFPAAGSPR